MRSEWPGEVGRVEVAHGFKTLLHSFWKSSAVAGKRYLAKGLYLVRAAFDVEAALVEDDVFL